MSGLRTLIPAICKRHDYANYTFRMHGDHTYRDGLLDVEGNLAVKMHVFNYDGGYVVTRIWCNLTEYCWCCVGFGKTEGERDRLMTIGKIALAGSNVVRAGEVFFGYFSMGIVVAASHTIKVVNQTLLNFSSSYAGADYTYGYT